MTRLIAHPPTKFAFMLFILLTGCIPASKISTEPVLSTLDITGEAVYSVFVNSQTSAEKILLTNLDTNETVELTDSGSNSAPKWSSDGNQILYLSWTSENYFDIYIMNKDGSNKRSVLSTPANERMADWSPDQRKIVFISDKDGSSEIYTIDLETQIVSRLTYSPADKAFPSWSSDGKNIAFVSSVEGDGRLQVFTMDVDGANIKQVTDYNPDYFNRDPIWCPDDDCIVFTRLAGSAKLMLLDLHTMEIAPFVGDFVQPEQGEVIDQGKPTRSPVRGFVTFSVGGTFYAMDIKRREIYPLGIHALDLSLYP